MSLFSLLVLVLVFALLFFLARMIPDPSLRTVAIVVLVVIAILVLLNMVGLVPLGDLRIN